MYNGILTKNASLIISANGKDIKSDITGTVWDRRKDVERLVVYI